jgi:hypothetical protein
MEYDPQSEFPCSTFFNKEILRAFGLFWAKNSWEIGQESRYKRGISHSWSILIQMGYYDLL